MTHRLSGIKQEGIEESQLLLTTSPKMIGMPTLKTFFNTGVVNLPSEHSENEGESSVVDEIFLL